MGQKVNPHGLRVGIIKDWDSKWYASDAEFSDFLVEDYDIRKYLKKKLFSAGISKIEIERASDRVKVVIYTAKPGVVIGKGGAEIEITKKELAKMTGKKVLVVLPENNEVIYKSTRNIEGAKVSTVNTLNVYDILNCDTIVVLKDAVTKIEEVYA